MSPLKRAEPGVARGSDRWKWGALCVVITACGGGPRSSVYDAVAVRDVSRAMRAYNEYREVDGADAHLLGAIAALVLEEAALSPNESVRDAALVQLRLAGSAGLPTLRKLASSAGQSVVRARALEALTRRGDRQARAYLYGMLDTDDPQILASALTAVDGGDEPERLLGALGDPSPEVRKAAALGLGKADASNVALRRLGEVARIDPEVAVRSAAVRALGGFGAAALPALRERLGDPDSQVRLAVVRALVRADENEAVSIVRSLLATPPSRAGIEAARVIALTEAGSDADVEDARAYLLSALGADASPLRAQAAVALVSLPDNAASDGALLTALEDEHEAYVRLGIARALMDREVGADEAREVFEGLLESEGIAQVQAAAILARDDHERALQVLEGTLEGDDALLRRVAARALAREAMRPDAVRALLQDDDDVVRVHAAGGILAAASAS